MIRQFLIAILFPALLFCKGQGKVFAQVNLVPNPSFEEYSSCPTYQEQIFKAIPWTRATTDYPEYFNACADSLSNASIPDNILGHQFARTGSAYAAFGVGIFQNANVREYLSVQLTDSLLKDTVYKVSFFVSMAEISSLAIDNLGAYFSKDSVYVSTAYPLPFTPQIKSPSGFSIKDTVNWIEVGGQYISQGGEQYIIIGCFVPDSLLSIDTIAISTWNSAYYLLDDVVVTSDTLWGVGVEENQKSKIKNQKLEVYPNPGNGRFTILSPQPPINKIEVFNILGEKVRSTEVNGERYGEIDGSTISASSKASPLTIDLSKEPAGMYFVKVGNYCAKVIKE